MGQVICLSHTGEATMKVWAISGGSLPTIYIKADSFDDAIKQARQIDSRYCGGYVYSE